MASTQAQGHRRGPHGQRVVYLGAFTISCYQGKKRIHLSKKLDDLEFPLEAGEELDVQVIQPEGADPWIELHPKEE